ncbi:competence type IV pilus major pilin ComGC [Sporosarcina gallistercoris]|uniref:Type II secretion system protein n=1 Tax=Sporosarcina gallistercoris TaxID=2762245 RepID=A0ABR8PJM3_9BACL|nr:type II secretion system protein [Sporosarcina gallistercoris]MBD7908390.1 type II secretion system protein [Sporosarcina gallistercoris]
MKKFLQKKLKNEKGLTLVELLAVIVILGIIAAIAVPSIGGIIENTRVKAVKADAQTAIAAGSLYFAENADTKDITDSVTVSELVSSGYLADKASLDDTSTVTKSKLNTDGTTGNKTTSAAYFDGEGTYSGTKKVKFEKVTSKEITESGKATTVKGTAK